MKTIRERTFESNSSSTHVYTFSGLSKGRCDLTVVPDENNEVHVKFSSWVELDSSVSPLYKAKLLLALAFWDGGQEKFAQVKRVFEEFTGADLICEGAENLQEAKPVGMDYDEDEDENEFREYFSGHAHEWGDVNAYREYLESDETIRHFIFCSKNCLDEEITYD